MPWLMDEKILERVRRLEIRFNRHGVDRFGASQVHLARLFTVLSWLHHHYFRVTALGLENVPAAGRAMLVGNHSGGWALDGLMVLASLFFAKEPPRLAQGMADKFVHRLPFAAASAVRTGQLTGLPEHAAHLLADERLLLVFPEGARGTAKLYGDRNTLVRFGTGFLRLALATRAPIIPFAFLGGGEAIPTVLNLRRLGELLGVPYIPVTPYLVPLPRPVPLAIHYGEAMRFAGTGSEEDNVIGAWVDQVKARIAALIERGERVRRTVESGE